MILLVLIYMSYLDLKYRQISNASLIILLLSVVLTTTSPYYLLSIISYVLMYILYPFIENQIGGGDIKVIIILLLKYGFIIFEILFIASSISIFILLLVKQIKYLPFIPFITLGVIYVQI